MTGTSQDSFPKGQLRCVSIFPVGTNRAFHPQKMSILLSLDPVLSAVLRSAAMDDRMSHVAVWQQWVRHRGPIYTDIINMNYRRVLFRGFMNGIANLQAQHLADQVDESPRMMNVSWPMHYGRAYFAEQAIAVRRHIDAGRHRDPVISLRRLFEEIEQRPDEVSGAAYTSWTSGESVDSLRTYRRLFGSGGDVLDLPAWRAKRDEFLEAADTIKIRVDKTLAHADEKILSEQHDDVLPPTTWTDLHEAIDVLTGAFRHAFLLLAGGDLDPVPAIQFDYRAPFRTAMFRSIPGSEWSIPISEFPDEAEDVPFG